MAYMRILERWHCQYPHCKTPAHFEVLGWMGAEYGFYCPLHARKKFAEVTKEEEKYRRDHEQTLGLESWIKPS